MLQSCKRMIIYNVIFLHFLFQYLNRFRHVIYYSMYQIITTSFENELNSLYAIRSTNRINIPDKFSFHYLFTYYFHLNHNFFSLMIGEKMLLENYYKTISIVLQCSLELLFPFC